MDAPARVALIFIDGLGWGPADPATNPGWTYGGRLFRLPDPPAGGAPLRLSTDAWARAVDACLGVAGLPQSATGQTTLLTGVNAQAAQGAHLSGFPGPTLRAILLEHSLLKRLREAGRRPVFFNTYRSPFFQLPRERHLRMSATTIANLAADLPFFDVPDMARGRSLYQEFTGQALRDLGFDVPLFTPEAAGGILARNLPLYDFLLYEYFLTDKAGHTGDREAAEHELRRLDAFLGAALAELPADALLIVCSDHGNLEDVSVKTHTRNPVPLLAWGRGAGSITARVDRLDQVAPAILALLS
ncbi:MAG TPA: alkaline phosphatase family protein [Candidatus Krumholzibacteria bacterium]|nr:alkaline phosphatase family protein [Candidatus Krumholzibacteria bacterium]HPD72353.1 alkaline phosphatase family protein [Candidatus Krumholzibacteria bacterium]HRY40715.1 alkaline phosphatase family protein [Candidatus Krumholzibacteria bacterium]